MNSINLLIILSMALGFIIGCSDTETPRQRFETFVQALKEKNETLIQDSLEVGSFNFLVEAGTSKSSSDDWLTNLSKDTLESNPSFHSLEWLLRDKQAEITYISQDGTKNSILLVLVDKTWKIRLQPLEAHDQGIKEYELPKQRK